MSFYEMIFAQTKFLQMAFGKRLINVHSLLQSAMKAFLGNPKLSSPLRHALSFPIMVDANCISLIPQVLCSWHPAAVTLSVIVVIINSLYLKTVAFLRTHVFHEIFYFMPSMVYDDSSAAIILVIFMRFIVASVHHVHPGAINFCSTHAVRALTATTATGRFSTDKVSIKHLSNKTAVTSATPVARSISNLLNDVPFLEYASGFNFHGNTMHGAPRWSNPFFLNLKA